LNDDENPQLPRAASPAGERSVRASTPWALGWRGWWEVVSNVYLEIFRDRLMLVAAGVAVYVLLSIFPALSVVIWLYGFFADPARIVAQIQNLDFLLPPGAFDVIQQQAKAIAATGPSGMSFIIFGGILLALWSANAAMKAMFDALNVAYGATDRRGFFMLNLVSLGFTLAAIVGLVVMIVVIAVVPAVLAVFNLGLVGDVLLWAGRWPVMLVLAGLALAVLYQWGPSRPDVAWRWITPGSALASIALLAFSMLFSWYAANIANYNGTYGSLGAVIGFLIWMWLSTTIILVGAELNAVVEEAGRPQGTQGGDGGTRR